MTKNFPDLVREKDTQGQEAQTVSNRMDSKRRTSRHIIIKMAKLKDKEKILKGTSEEQLVIYNGAPIIL